MGPQRALARPGRASWDPARPPRGSGARRCRPVAGLEAVEERAHRRQGPGVVAGRLGIPAQAGGIPTAGSSAVTFINRIVAGPGDTLAIRGGHAYGNGTIQRDNFTKACAAEPAVISPTQSRSPPATGSRWATTAANRPDPDECH